MLVTFAAAAALIGLLGKPAAARAEPVVAPAPRLSSSARGAGPDHSVVDEKPPGQPSGDSATKTTPRSAEARPSSPELSQAPDFALRDLLGGTVTSRYAERPVTVVRFWASFCVPCIREIPEVNRLAATYEPMGAAIFAISSDDASAAELRQMQRAYGIRHTVLLADRGILGAFGGIEAFPTTFIVDSSGRIVEKHVGETPEARQRVEASVRRLLAAARHAPSTPPER